MNRGNIRNDSGRWLQDCGGHDEGDSKECGDVDHVELLGKVAIGGRGLDYRDFDVLLIR